MNQTIINQYQISFINKIIDFEIIGKKNRKIAKSNNSYLSEFLMDCNVSDINDSVLPDINSVLTNSIMKENGSEILDVLIYHNKVDFYDKVGFVYTLPTTDFKEIVIGWRDFLLTPPLNGAKVQ
jgi:hypothetical protein